MATGDERASVMTFQHPLAMIALKITSDRNVIDFTPHLRRKRLENSRLVRKSIDQIIAEADDAMLALRERNDRR
jgi:hypothetical protein